MERGEKGLPSNAKCYPSNTEILLAVVHHMSAGGHISVCLCHNMLLKNSIIHLYVYHNSTYVPFL